MSNNAHVVGEPTTLLEVLKQVFPQSSTTTLRKMLTQGRVLVNDAVVHRSREELHIGDTVMVLPHQQAAERTPPPEKALQVDIDIVYEDEHILVVTKPPHQLTVATDRLETDTLHSRCVDHVRQSDPSAWCYIVHRLDRETSGILILAKDKRSKDHLQEQFSERAVHRLYRARVEGQPQPPQGTVRTWLMEDKHLNVKAVNANHPKGKEAISHYHTLASDGSTALIEVEIETGRRHQIRMAMQHLGTPIVGDERHGATTDPEKRIMLHAYALELLHPANDDPVRFESPLPRGF